MDNREVKRRMPKRLSSSNPSHGVTACLSHTLIRFLEAGFGGPEDDLASRDVSYPYVVTQFHGGGDATGVEEKHAKILEETARGWRGMRSGVLRSGFGAFLATTGSFV